MQARATLSVELTHYSAPGGTRATVEVIGPPRVIWLKLRWLDSDRASRQRRRQRRGI